MSTFFLLNPTRIGTSVHLPGELIDDANQNATAFTATGGILWPSSDVSIAAAAQQAGFARARGATEAELMMIMLAGAAKASKALADAAQASASTVVQKRSVALVFGSFVGGTGVEAVNLDVALPANARILGREVRVTTPFTGGTVSAATLEIGSAGVSNEIMVATSVFTGGAAAFGGANGVNANKLYAAATQLLATFRTTGGNTGTCTAGAAVVDVFFAVLP